jgi:hypothetical protein
MKEEIKSGQEFPSSSRNTAAKNNPSGKFNFKKIKMTTSCENCVFPIYRAGDEPIFIPEYISLLKKAAIQSNPFFLNLILQPSLLRWSGIPFRQLHVVHNPPWFIFSLGSIYILRCGWGPPWPSVKCYGSTTVQAPPTLCRVSVASSIAKVDRLIPKPIFLVFLSQLEKKKKSLACCHYGTSQIPPSPSPP